MTQELLFLTNSILAATASAFAVAWLKSRKSNRALLSRISDAEQKHDELSMRAYQRGLTDGEASAARARADEISKVMAIHQEQVQMMLQKYQTQMDEQQNRLFKDRNDAVAKAIDNVHQELEARTKAFSVQVSPFVRASDVGNLISQETKIVSGYNYQLMIHGMPAFNPHECILEEKTVKRNSEQLNRLTDEAITLLAKNVEQIFSPAGTIVKIVAPVKKLLGKSTG